MFNSVPLSLSVQVAGYDDSHPKKPLETVKVQASEPLLGEKSRVSKRGDPCLPNFVQ